MRLKVYRTYGETILCDCSIPTQLVRNIYTKIHYKFLCYLLNLWKLFGVRSAVFNLQLTTLWHRSTRLLAGLNLNSRVNTRECLRLIDFWVALNITNSQTEKRRRNCSKTNKDLDLVSYVKVKKKKAIPVTGRETLRPPYFLDNWLTDGGDVSFMRRPPFTPRNIPGTHFC
jgi:hypothetical protein